MNEVQVKGVEARIYACHRWGLAFFAVAMLLISGVVGRYLQIGEFDIMFWLGVVAIIGSVGAALSFGMAGYKHTTSLIKYLPEEKSDV